MNVVLNSSTIIATQWSAPILSAKIESNPPPKIYYHPESLNVLYSMSDFQPQLGMPGE